MAANKRMPSRRPNNGRDLARESTRDRKARLADRKKDIHEEIHRLECLITAAPRVAKQRHLARIDMIPPYDTDMPLPRNRHVGELPLQQQIAIKRRRLLLMGELGLFGIGIVGIAGWLNQFLHFFH